MLFTNFVVDQNLVGKSLAFDDMGFEVGIITLQNAYTQKHPRHGDENLALLPKPLVTGTTSGKK